jgi:hypothetical protein
VQLIYAHLQNADDARVVPQISSGDTIRVDTTRGPMVRDALQPYLVSRAQFAVAARKFYGQENPCLLVHLNVMQKKECEAIQVRPWIWRFLVDLDVVRHNLDVVFRIRVA